MNIKKTVAILGVALFMNKSFAEPNVLYSTGKTQSITPYLEPLNISTPPALQPALQEGFKPFSSAGLTQGKVVARTVNLPFLQFPLFLVGPDDRSLNWLMRNRQALINIGAVGFLVEATTQEDVERVARAAKGLRLSPVPVASLARAYKLKHYPALITKSSITQ